VDRHFAEAIQELEQAETEVKKLHPTRKKKTER
jgi:hypothetical protein